jgi:hypothetical protein
MKEIRGEDAVFPIHNVERKIETYTLKAAKNNFGYYGRSLVPYHNNFDPRTKFFLLVLWNSSATAIAFFLISDPRQPCN